MPLHKRLSLLFLLSASSVFAMDFADFDTTVQVKTFTENTSDSTFIPLRNTGFTLSYTITKALECPYVYVRGDLQIRPDTSWLIRITGDFGDSAYYPQTAVYYYCSYQMYVRQFLTPGSKYQMHIGVRKNAKGDTLYTMVKSRSNDSTFTLSVSARSFGTTSVRRQGKTAPTPQFRDGFSADGRRMGPRSRIWIDRSGNKEIDLRSN
jgi:hypothetical protein